MEPLVTLRGRGAAANPKNRFEALEVLPDPEARDPDDPGPRTRLLRDATRTILATNDSPDIGFNYSVNPYRGCEHGCIYCYARPTHEYLGFSAGLDFESVILVKMDAPTLLRDALMSKRWQPELIAMCGVTDPYQPVERRLQLTRGCLEVLAEFRNPVAIITKNHLVTRDIDVFVELAAHNAVAVNISVTTLDEKLQRIMEPRTSIPTRRLEAIRKLSAAGIPVGVMVAPVIPGLTDHEMPRILEAAAEASARSAAMVTLRLPHGVSDLFTDWLERHFPDRKEKVLNRVRSMRGGRLYDSKFGKRMSGEGIWADQIRSVFQTARKRLGLDRPRFALSVESFRRPSPGGQLDLL